MSRTLNLLDRLLGKARHLHELGRSRDALPILRRFIARPELPEATTIEARRLLGEAYLAVREYRHARRQFTALLRLRPDDAVAHHHLANAHQNDPQVDARRASRHFRRAVELAPDNPAILADGGKFAVAMGRSRKGLALLRKAVELAPNDLAVFGSYIDALCDLDRRDEARRELAVARFRLGRESRFQRIWENVEFQQARDLQRAEGRLAKAVGESPAVLPFLRIHDGDARPVRAKRFVRRDAVSGQRPHFPRVIRDSSNAPRPG
ncbi:MAG: hypothetical protein ACJ8F7_10020 [Gemmataceae bacterium]